MIDARRRAVNGIGALRRLVEAGPPPRPTPDQPGQVLKAFMELINQIGDPEHPPSPTDAAAALAHVLDMESWKVETEQFLERKALLEAMEKRITVPLLVPK